MNVLNLIGVDGSLKIILLPEGNTLFEIYLNDTLHPYTLSGRLSSDWYDRKRVLFPRPRKGMRYQPGMPGLVWGVHDTSVEVRLGGSSVFINHIYPQQIHLLNDLHEGL